MKSPATGKPLAAGAAAAAIVLALAGCGSNDTDTDTTAASQTATSDTAATGHGEHGDSAHNDADVAFVQGMIPHHEQAVEMSDMILAKPDIDPRVVELAQQIKDAQGPEIETMNGWLTTWGVSAETEQGDTNHDDMGHGDMSQGDTDSGAMDGHSGMMSEDDMNALADAQGVDAAKLYLTQMIAHHQGAVEMAQTEIDTGENPDAVALAHQIVETQQAEITTMENIATSL
ncbi:DUF305 domain-containing protein [Rhodococcus sp. HNM0569]|uniref:DUF305 domain-containing protein n=1 Tax=Rhodococcus sp. HNM0569 TaxID=2716340 RepID=UPI00146C9EE0|nr:DUF305 domain-containing protein [Rhodococcus sp. HNM0569]NLU84547.1 DUF305 domain-containing protein [Rhodococcus sp. HNM0569]